MCWEEMRIIDEYDEKKFSTLDNIEKRSLS